MTQNHLFRIVDHYGVYALSGMLRRELTSSTVLRTCRPRMPRCVSRKRSARRRTGHPDRSESSCRQCRLQIVCYQTHKTENTFQHPDVSLRPGVVVVDSPPGAELDRPRQRAVSSRAKLSFLGLAPPKLLHHDPKSITHFNKTAFFSDQSLPLIFR